MYARSVPHFSGFFQLFRDLLIIHIHPRRLASRDDRWQHTEQQAKGQPTTHTPRVWLRHELFTNRTDCLGLSGFSLY